MPKRNVRVYHGGPANTGSGGSGYTLFDRLLDGVGNVLLQGIALVVRIKSGVSIQADVNIMIQAVTAVNGDATMQANRNVVLSSGSLTRVSSGNTASIYGVVATTIGLAGLGKTYMLNIPGAASQAAGGIVATQVWRTQGHALLPDGVMMIGI